LQNGGHGVFIEEFIAFDLLSVLRSTDTKQSLLMEIVRYAAILQGLGFSAIAPYSDLRSRGHDVVVVDFGSDLGPPGRQTSVPSYFVLLEEWLEHEGIPFECATFVERLLT
jgi:hypothetical protein